MIITNLTLQKMDHSDPRYPDPIKDRPFSDVYRLEATMDDGSQQESVFFVMDHAGPMTTQRTANMLKGFVRAIENMTEEKAA